MKFNRTDVITICGRRGCGKSYLTSKIIDLYPRVVIIDTLDDEIYNKDSYIHVKSLNELGFYIKTTIYDKKFVIVYHFEPETENYEAEYDKIMKVLYYRGDILVVVEEIQTFSNTNIAGLTHFTFNILLKGRHRKIAFIATTQRPALLNKTILSQSNHVFTGNLQSKTDIDSFVYHTGLDKEDIFNLPERVFIYKALGKAPKKVKNNLTLL